MTPEECERKADELRSLVFVQQDLIHTYCELAVLLRTPYERLVVSDRITETEFGQCLPADLYPAVLAILERRILLLTEKLDGSKTVGSVAYAQTKQTLIKVITQALASGENIRYHLRKLAEQVDMPRDHVTYDNIVANLDELRECCSVATTENKDEQP